MNANHATLEFRAHEALVTARLPDDALAEAYAGLYGTGRRAPLHVADPDLVVDRHDAAYALHGDPEGTETCATAETLLPTFEWAVTRLLLARERCCVHVHAAGAVEHGRAVLALGTTGAGKSTLALHWSRSGLPVLGDDTILIDPEGRARAFPRLFKLDPAVADPAGLNLAATPWWTPGSTEAWYDPAAGGGWAEPAPVGLVAVLRYVPGAPLRVETVSPSPGLAALLASRQMTGRGGAEAFDALRRALDGARVLSVTHGRTAGLAPALREMAA